MCVKLKFHCLEKLWLHASLICVHLSIKRVGGKEICGVSTHEQDSTLVLKRLWNMHNENRQTLHCFLERKRSFHQIRINLESRGGNSMFSVSSSSAILMQLRGLEWISIVIYISNLKCASILSITIVTHFTKTLLYQILWIFVCFSLISLHTRASHLQKGKR